MYNTPLASVLWFLLVLMLSLYTWGYFRPTYIRHSNISVLAGSGRYNSNFRFALPKEEQSEQHSATKMWLYYMWLCIQAGMIMGRLHRPDTHIFLARAWLKV